MRRAAWVLVVMIWGAELGCILPASAQDAAPAPMSREMSREAMIVPGEAGTADRQTDISARARRRPPTRLRGYGRTRYLPPSARRECRAWYVEEHRPSGTVITPRQQCWWVRG